MDDPVFYVSGHNDDENYDHKDDNNDDTQGSSTVPYPSTIFIFVVLLDFLMPKPATHAMRSIGRCYFRTNPGRGWAGKKQMASGNKKDFFPILIDINSAVEM